MVILNFVMKHCEQQKCVYYYRKPCLIGIAETCLLFALMKRKSRNMEGNASTYTSVHFIYLVIADILLISIRTDKTILKEPKMIINKQCRLEN